MIIEYGVLDADTGHVKTGFKDEQEARDWMNPNVGNPNPGPWILVARQIHPWYRVDA